MLKKLKSLFNDPSNAPSAQLQLVQVQGTQRPEPASKEIRESIISLQYHAGFQWLMKKLAFQTAIIDSRLRTEKHTELKDVHLLQSMINGFNWLEQQIDQEVQASKLSQRVPATPFEQQLFEQVSSAIEKLE
jgi:hypothetical protein